jgi:hypothetical protein
MTEREPTAAAALYGHLPSAEREPVQQRTPRFSNLAKPSVAQAMFPSLPSLPKAPPHPLLPRLKRAGER